MSPRRRLYLVLFVGCIAMGVAMLVALAVAPAGLGLSALGSGAPFLARRFVMAVRLPRILLGAVAGGGLGIAGATLQGLLRNPLADPYVLGVSGGAALGGVLALHLGSVVGLPLLLGVWGLRIGGSIAGAAAVSVFITWLLLSGRVRDSSGVILAGIAVNLVALAFLSLIEAIADPNDMQATFFWLVGSLSELPPGAGVPLIGAGVVLLATILLLGSGRALNLAGLGEEAAGGAGLDLRSLLLRTFAGCALAAGAVAALAGLIGFVGLVVPHLLRRVCGPDHRILLPASALGGATMLVLCDTAVRALFPLVGTELPVGSLTALLGAPMLLLLLLRSGDHHYGHPTNDAAGL